MKTSRKFFALMLILVMLVGTATAAYADDVYKTVTFSLTNITFFVPDEAGITEGNTVTIMSYHIDPFSVTLTAAPGYALPDSIAGVRDDNYEPSTGEIVTGWGFVPPEIVAAGVPLPQPLTLHANAPAGAAGTVENMPGNGTVNTGDALGMSSPSLPGYTFVGWNTQADGKGNGYTASSAMPAGGLELYAIWNNANPILGGTGGTLTFTNRTLTDSATGVTVTGSFVSGAKLGVAKNALHMEGACTACDEIRERMRADSLIVHYDISATGHKGDGVSVTIPVGNGYDGHLLSVLHCDHGRLEEKILTCADGAVTGTFSSLSPFAVFDGVSVATPDEVVVDAPKTGDSLNVLGLAMLALCVVAAGRKKWTMDNGQ